MKYVDNSPSNCSRLEYISLKILFSILFIDSVEVMTRTHFMTLIYGVFMET